DHGLIKTMRFRSKIPAYIPSWTFAKAALELVRQSAGTTAPTAGTTLTLAEVQSAVGTLPSPVKEALAPLVATATNLDELHASIERWFNEAMGRVSGVYKRWNMLILVILSLVVSVTLNADTF